MSFDEAQNFYCRLEPINPAFIETVRESVRSQERRLGPSCKDRDGKACTRSAKNYYGCHFRQMEQNFDICLREAQANRAASRIPNRTEVSAVLTERGNIIDMRITGGSISATSTVPNYLGLIFGTFDIDLCKVTKAGPSAAPVAAPQPATNTNPAAPIVAPTGSDGIY